MPLEHTADSHGDGTCFLRNDDHHRVGVLAHADTGPVPHAQVAAQVHVFAQRQHAARAQDPSAADDDRAVVHGRLDEKDVFQQLGGHGGVQRRTASHHVIQMDVALKDDQHAGLAQGHLLAGHHGLIDGRLQLRLLLGIVEGPQQFDVPAAHLLQYLADLRLEQDDNGQDPHLHQVPHEVRYGVELQYINQPKHQQKRHHALEDILGAGTFDHTEQVVYQKRDNGDVQYIRYPYQQ